jgi:hypothetical protein
VIGWACPASPDGQAREFPLDAEVRHPRDAKSLLPFSHQTHNWRWSFGTGAFFCKFRVPADDRLLNERAVPEAFRIGVVKFCIGEERRAP